MNYLWYLLCPNVLMNPSNPLFKSWILENSLQATEHLFLFRFNINFKLKLFLSVELVIWFVLVCKLMQLVDEVKHEIMHYQNQGLSYLPKLKITQT